eukprot:TRINITY_DN15921_c0_g1_i1.p2 TRINITY_DN15921_c0_g1~~TRINITY_DN15921_c0_g1_i1.p2  ORF type:complete len:207 (-),score=2.96 TRINITY_DN15921_c0_g1_i1:883-1503(-)
MIITNLHGKGNDGPAKEAVLLLGDRREIEVGASCLVRIHQPRESQARTGQIELQKIVLHLETTNHHRRLLIRLGRKKRQAKHVVAHRNHRIRTENLPDGVRVLQNQAHRRNGRAQPRTRNRLGIEARIEGLHAGHAADIPFLRGLHESVAHRLVDRRRQPRVRLHSAQRRPAVTLAVHLQQTAVEGHVVAVDLDALDVDVVLVLAL